MGLRQNKMVLQSKEKDQQNENTICWIGEVFANDIFNKRFISKSHKDSENQTPKQQKIPLKTEQREGGKVQGISSANGR